MEAIKLELEFNGDPIRGRLIRETTGEQETFVGWIELAAALERIRLKAEERPPAA
jgi:hypothetical protein